MDKKRLNVSLDISDTRLAKKPAAAQQSFFNPKPVSLANKKIPAKQEQSTQTELPERWSRTEFLLLSIVNELRRQNELRSMELNLREVEKQIAIKEEQARQKADQERFEEHKSSLYM